jgi:hypothetical protein
MAWLVVLGAVLMGSGALLVLLQRRVPGRRPVLAEVSVAATGRFKPLLAHLHEIDDVAARLEQAVDAVVPARGADGQAPTREGVAVAYADVGDRLVGLAKEHLRRPPSAAVTRFVAVSEGVSEAMRDGREDPYAGELAEVEAAVLRSGRAVETWRRALEQYADERLRRAVAARQELLRALQTFGDALRWDRRRQPSASAQLRADVGQVVHELGRGISGYLDALRPLAAADGGRSLKRRERAELGRRIADVERQVAAADAQSAHGAPFDALRALTAVSLPNVAGRSADAALATACGAAAAGLRVVAARRAAELWGLAAHCATAVDRHLTALHDTVAADTEARRRADRAAFEAVVAAAGFDAARFVANGFGAGVFGAGGLDADGPTTALPTRPLDRRAQVGAPDAATVETRSSQRS